MSCMDCVPEKSTHTHTHTPTPTKSLTCQWSFHPGIQAHSHPYSVIFEHSLIADLSFLSTVVKGVDYSQRHTVIEVHGRLLLVPGHAIGCGDITHLLGQNTCTHSLLWKCYIKRLYTSIIIYPVTYTDLSKDS